MSFKRFIFDFVNNYVSLFFLAFWDRSLAQLAQNLITFLVFKQVAFNIIEYLDYRVITALKIRRVSKHYDKLILQNPSQADQLRLQRDVERNIKMAPEGDFLIDSYLEGIK